MALYAARRAAFNLKTMALYIAVAAVLTCLAVLVSSAILWTTNVDEAWSTKISRSAIRARRLMLVSRDTWLGRLERLTKFRKRMQTDMELGGVYHKGIDELSPGSSDQVNANSA